MTRIPQPNLSPDSTPWARWAINEIADLRRGSERAAQANLNGAKAQNAALAQNAKQILELQTAQASLASTVAQLNAASDSKSISAVYTTNTLTNNAQLKRSAHDASVVTFTRPTWATRATVMVTGQVAAWGSENGQSNFTALSVRIDGESSPDQSGNIQVPGTGEIRGGGVVTGDLPYIFTPSALFIPYARSFATSAASINCGIRFSKGYTGVGHGFFLSVAATVFWSAN